MEGIFNLFVLWSVESPAKNNTRTAGKEELKARVSVPDWEEVLLTLHFVTFIKELKG